jgi:hypothetical protein
MLSLSEISFCARPFIDLHSKRASLLPPGKTIPAIYRAVSGGLERDFAFFVAIRANRLIESSLPETIALISILRTAEVIRALKRPRGPLPLADQVVHLPLEVRQLLLYVSQENRHIRLCLRWNGEFFLLRFSFHHTPFLDRITQPA